MEAAAGNDEALVMSPTNGSVKKKFRARKTMTASCRQQLATLKLKPSSKSENTSKEPPIKSVQQPELICEANFTEQDNAASKTNKSQGVFPNGLKVSIEVSQVDSEINFGCSYNETWEGISQKSEDVPFSHTAHFVVRDFNTAATENHVTGSDQVTSPADTASRVLSEGVLQIAESAPVQDAETESEQTSVACSTISENINASITVKIINEDHNYKKTSSIDVSSAEPPDADDMMPAQPPDADDMMPAEPPDADDVISAEPPDTDIATPAEPPDTDIATPAEPPDTDIVTPADPPDTDDVTPADPPDTDDVTPAEPPDTDDVTPAESPDTDDVNPAEPPDTDDVNPSEPPHTDDVNPSEPPDTDDVNPAESPDTDDVNPSEPPDADDVNRAEPPDTDVTDDVTPEEPPDTDVEVPKNVLDVSNCATDGSNARASPSTFSAISDSVHPEYNAAVGGCEKKRTRSESSDVPEAKRAKTSNCVLLDEIQCLIDRRINKLFEDRFEQRMQTLLHQAKLVRKNGNRKGDITKHLSGLSRLQRRLKCAVLLQKELGARSTKLTPVSSSPMEVSSPDASNTCTAIPPADTTQPLPRTPTAQNATSSSMDLVVLSDNESEQPSNSEQSQSERSKTSSKEAMKKIMESIKEHRKKARDNPVKAVIDLTDDEEQKCDKVVAEHPTSGTSSEGSSSVGNIFDKYSAKKDLAMSSNNEATVSSNVNEAQQSIPASPQSESLQASEAIPKTASTSEPPELKPPQKPQLRLAQVQNPKGIALSWNVVSVDPSCAPAKFYCLYVHQGDPNNPKKLWKKIGEIEALPLPMACTLKQFVEDSTYSFAMRAKDAKGRFGPLCDIQSTTLKLQGSSKKS